MESGESPRAWGLLNDGMKLERGNHLGAASFRRSKTRIGHANGYKPEPSGTSSGRSAWTSRRFRMGASIRPCYGNGASSISSGTPWSASPGNP